jgi:hypothetical protein
VAWNYSGDPSAGDRDAVRFLVGDTCETDQLLQDAEVEYAIAQQPSNELAAAYLLRALAAKFSRMVTNKVGDVSVNCSDLAKAYADRANELDPTGITKKVPLALPSFGGRSLDEKETLAEDTDAVQPSFSRGMNDVPGGWPDGPEDTNELTRSN